MISAVWLSSTLNLPYKYNWFDMKYTDSKMQLLLHIVIYDLE